jgi:signal transduction histidine kinase
LVHKVIVMHDGQIEVDSSPGHGATMTLVLPARPGDAAAGAALS